MPDRTSGTTFAGSWRATFGIASFNIDDTAGDARPVLTVLLDAGIPIVEHVTNLAALPADGFRFSAVGHRAIIHGSGCPQFAHPFKFRITARGYIDADACGVRQLQCDERNAGGGLQQDRCVGAQAVRLRNPVPAASVATGKVAASLSERYAGACTTASASSSARSASARSRECIGAAYVGQDELAIGREIATCASSNRFRSELRRRSAIDRSLVDANVVPERVATAIGRIALYRKVHTKRRPSFQFDRRCAAL